MSLVTSAATKSANQLAQLRADVALLDKRFADENRARAALLRPRHVRARVNAAFGDEEIRIIAPTIASEKKRGLDVVGPLSGDTVFHYALQGDFDAIVAMYHDQGLAPLKAVAFDTGVNWTLGLPFIRTSPDHGTAYDIAGKGIANPSSMIAAIRLAKQLAGNKK